MNVFYFYLRLVLYLFFFFQAEDGIRDIGVTGVQTCALPISDRADFSRTTSPPPRNPCSPNSRRTSRAALSHRISSCHVTSVHPLQRLNRTGSRPHRVIMPTFPSTRYHIGTPPIGGLSARSSLRLPLVSTPPSFARRLVSISASPTPASPSCTQRTTAGGAQVLC